MRRDDNRQAGNPISSFRLPAVFLIAALFALDIPVAIFVPGLCEEAGAQTPRLQGQSASAVGMGNAFTAQADDPSALHYNPAGMTQLPGVQNLFGTSLIGGTTQFTSPTGQQVTGDRNGSVAWPPPGHVYITANLKDLGITALGDLTAGIGLNNPFGSLTRYPNNGPFRTAVTFNTLPLLDIKPTLAYKLNDQISLGLGVDIYTFSGLFGEGQVEQRSIWPGGLGIPAGSAIELNGTDTTAGFNVSLLYTPYRNADGKPLVNIGLVYRSQASLHLTGEFRANGALVSDAAATLVLPPVYSGGIAVWPVRSSDHEWKLELDVDYVGWKSNRNLDIHLSNGTLIPFPQNWQNAYTVMIGTEYKWLRPAAMPDWEIALRAGYLTQQTQVPDRTFNPGIPSAVNHVPSVGIGLMCKEAGSLFGIKCGHLGIGPLKPKLVGLDLAYQAGFFEVRTINGNQNPTVNGRYDTLIHVGAISLRFNY